MKLRTRHKPSRCPWCGSENIALMLNGMPVFTHDLESSLEEGGIVVGPITREHDGPVWQCTDCYAEFYRENAPPR